MNCLDLKRAITIASIGDFKIIEIIEDFEYLVGSFIRVTVFAFKGPFIFVEDITFEL